MLLTEQAIHDSNNKKKRNNTNTHTQHKIPSICILKNNNKYHYMRYHSKTQNTNQFYGHQNIRTKINMVTIAQIYTDTHTHTA